MKQKKYILNVSNLKDLNKKKDLKYNLYIGEWCKDSLIKDSIEKKIETVKYHWNDQQKFNKDFLYLQELYEVFLDELSKKLNSIHGLSYSAKYWKIVIGPWLMKFIIVTFDRWESIKNAQKNYKISYVKIADFSKNEQISLDEYNFDLNLQDDFWNNCFFFQLISGWTDIRIKKFNFFKKNIKKSISRLNLLDYFVTFYNCFSKFFFKKNFFFIGTYFGVARLFWLQIRLKQFPFFFKKITIKESNINLSMRNWKMDRFYKSRDIFKDILSSLIPQYIPIVYIEGFKDAVNISNKHYGVESKIIFTSHSFYNDDYFKIWLAERLTKSKSRLISGQHGGGYFTCKHFFFEHHQLKVSDYMISWGYSKKNNNKIIPGFNYKVRDKNFISKLDSNKVNLLLIGYLGGAYSSRCYSTFSGPQNIFYLKDQYTFIKNLKKEIKKKILFRPKNFFPQKEILTYKNLSLNINIDNSFKSITDTIQNRKIKICVVTLNSTVFLEMLNINFPTILFTNLKYDQIRDEAKPYYDILMDSGVFFDSPDKAALKINEVWNNVDLWWNSKAIQKSVDYFCARFSKRSEKPVSDLYNIFTRI